MRAKGELGYRPCETIGFTWPRGTTVPQGGAQSTLGICRDCSRGLAVRTRASQQPFSLLRKSLGKRKKLGTRVRIPPAASQNLNFVFSNSMNLCGELYLRTFESKRCISAKGFFFAASFAIISSIFARTSLFSGL